MSSHLTKAKQLKNERLLLEEIEEFKHEIRVLKRSNDSLREENQELNKRDIVHINTECVMCSNHSKDKEELKRVTIECDSAKTLNLVLLAVIVIIIIGWWIG